MAETLAEQIGLESLGPDEYISKSLPRGMGNTAPIGYGGITLGLAVHAACLSVSTSHHLYSVVGHYHGPAALTRKLKCKVERTRDTRSFATRRVQVSQDQPDGKTRICMDLLVDFHVKESAVFEYSAPPSLPYPAVEQCPPLAELDKLGILSGGITAKHAALHARLFKMTRTHFDIRACVDGISSQNYNSIAKDAVTTQDHLPITSKSSAEWFRLARRLSTEPEQMAAVAFLLDGGLAFLPLTHDHMSLDDVGACSSLDFALRIFVSADEVDLGKWCLNERRTIAAGAGRTYSENQLWDTEGRLLASMTQQSIMRAKPGAKASL